MAAPAVGTADEIGTAVAVLIEQRGHRRLGQLAHRRDAHGLRGRPVDHVPLAATACDLVSDRFDVAVVLQPGDRLRGQVPVMRREPAVRPQVVLAAVQRRIEGVRPQGVIGRVGHGVAELSDDLGVDLGLHVAAAPIGPGHVHGLVLLLAGEDDNQGHDDQGGQQPDQHQAAVSACSHFEPPRFSSLPVIALPPLPAAPSLARSGRCAASGRSVRRSGSRAGRAPR